MLAVLEEIRKIFPIKESKVPKDKTLEEIFGSNEMPIEEVYYTAQKVVKAYMDKTNKKIDYVARELGTTQGRLYKQLDPNQPETSLSVDRIIEITRLTSDTRLIETITHEVGMLAIKNKDVMVTLKDINHLTDKANIESSDVFRQVKLSLDDGKITKYEQEQSLKEIKEAQTALAALENSIKNLTIIDEDE